MSTNVISTSYHFFFFFFTAEWMLSSHLAEMCFTELSLWQWIWPMLESQSQPCHQSVLPECHCSCWLSHNFYQCSMWPGWMHIWNAVGRKKSRHEYLLLTVLSTWTYILNNVNLCAHMLVTLAFHFINLMGQKAEIERIENIWLYWVLLIPHL